MTEVNKNEYTNTEVVLEKENELDASFREEDSVYPMKDIKIDKGFYTVFELKRKYDSSNKKIILDSSFQRGNVWSNRQKAELIESVLMGLPLPIFYFNQDKFGNLIVIDGRQRLTALFEYIDGKFALNKLDILKEYSQKKFSDLEPIMQSKIEDYQIHSHVILPPTPDRIKFDIFDRVNRAGTQLNKQEIRNAIHQGKSTQLLNKIASENGNFKLATGGKFINEKRMKDRYIILRSISLNLFLSNKIRDENNAIYEYKNDMDDMLAKVMELLNGSTDEYINDIYEIVNFGLENSYFYLGENGFRVYKSEKKKSPINMNVFETLMYAMHQIPMKRESIRKFVSDKVEEIIESEAFLDSIGSHRDNKMKIEIRFNLAKKLVQEIIEYDKRIKD